VTGVQTCALPISVRHKTRKTRFKLVYVMAVLHLAAIVLLLAAWAGIL
jgi:uncharacterized membrane protein YsdA (DUF1294 family)